MNLKFWKKSKEVVEEEEPWWYNTTLQDVIEKKVDISQLLDEMTEYHMKRGWKSYNGWEALAVMLMIERKMQKDGK